MTFYKIEKSFEKNETKYPNPYKEITLLKEMFKITDSSQNLKDIQTTLSEKIKKVRADMRKPRKLKVQLSRGDYVQNTIVPADSNIVSVLQALKEKIIAEIKLDRSEYKRKRTTTKQKGRYNTQLIGGTYAEPGQIVRLFKIKLIDKIREYKKPLTGENHIAVEIELITARSRQDIEIDLLDMGLDKYVQTKDDGSISGFKGSGERGIEIALMAPETKFPDLLKKLTDYLNSDKVKATVNKTCGLHVHLDMRNRQSSVVFHNLVKCQDYLMNMLPASRRSNSYCKKVDTGTDINVAIRDRYRSINVESLSKHGTLEIRAHTGTTQFDKIFNWVTLLKRIADKKEKLERSPNSVSNLCNIFEINDNIKTYIETRIDKFSKATIEEDEHRTA